VLYEMLSGQTTFLRNSTAETTVAILKEEPPALSGSGVAVPAQLEQSVRRCLEKNPASRFQSASDLAYNLRSISTDQVVPRTKPTDEKTMRKRKALWSVAAVSLVFLGAIAAMFGLGVFDHLGSLGEGQPIRSLAVLPLENLSGDPGQEYFVDGMTEALIANLAQIEALKVISRTSAMRYKNTDKPLPQIARELNVDGIVEGSVLRVEDRVRITAQLIHASTDQHVWAGSYERDLKDILSLQKEVARTVAIEIRVRVTEPERDRLLEARRLNPEAYEHYLRGRWFWNRWNEEALWKGIELFNRAIDLDADFAPAYAGLADSFVILSFYSQTAPREVMPKAKTAALRAVALDDTLAEAHSSLGFVLTNYDFDWQGAETAHRRAIELNPGSVTAHMMYTWYLVGMTRFDEALAEIRKAHELSPLDVYVNRAVGDVLFYARRYDEAIVALQRAIEMDPHFTSAHFNLGRAYLQRAMYEEALAEFEEEMRISKFPDPVIRTWIGLAHAAMGREKEAYDILEDLTQRSEREYVPPSALASLHFALDRDDEGFEWLEKAYQGRDGWLASIKADPAYDRVRQDPRFTAFLKKMGLS
jgi:TolB-like protein/Flp pilus assembly protein TadD